MGVVGHAILAHGLLHLPPDERAEVHRIGLALGEVGGVVLREALGVDQALLVPLAEALDGGAPLLARGGEDDLVVLDDAVVVVVRQAADGRDEVGDVGAERVDAERQRDRTASLVRAQGLLVLVDRGGHGQAGLVEPGLVDEEEVREGEDAELLDGGQGVDVAVGGGDGAPDIGAGVEDALEDRGVRVDELLERDERAV